MIEQALTLRYCPEMLVRLRICQTSLLCTLATALSRSCRLVLSVDRSGEEEDKKAHPTNQDHRRGCNYLSEDRQVAVRVREANGIQDGGPGWYQYANKRGKTVPGLEKEQGPAQRRALRRGAS